MSGERVVVLVSLPSERAAHELVAAVLLKRLMGERVAAVGFAQGDAEYGLIRDAVLGVPVGADRSAEEQVEIEGLWEG